MKPPSGTAPARARRSAKVRACPTPSASSSTATSIRSPHSSSSSHRLALHSYSYLHLPLVAGIVLFALGLKTTLGHMGEALDTVPAVGLCGGAALYLLGHIAFLFRMTGRIFRRRTVGSIGLLALIPAAVALPALVALALVSAVCLVVVGYEVLRYREQRVRVRHPELAA